MSDEMTKFILKLKNVSIVGEDYYIFDFEYPKGISFKEGQYGVFMHVDKTIDGRKVRAFSVASSNNESVFKIATKIIESPSDFKVKMRELSIGDTMTYTGPMGAFVLEQEYDCVFIAGGIGITPIRGIIKQIENLNSKNKSVLIYSEPRGIYPFKDEFDEMNFLDKNYFTNIENTQDSIDRVSKEYQNRSYYYIAGSPRFIKGVTEQLVNNKVDSSHIKFDRFNGYE